MGTRIWSLIVEHLRIEPVVDALIAEYEAPPDRLRQDVLAFVETLREHGLLENPRA